MTGEPVPYSPVHSSTKSVDTPHIAKLLQLVGWTNLWVQLGAAIGAGVLLGISIISRQNVENESAATGFGIFLAVLGILLLGFGAFHSFRYTRIAKKLTNSAGTIIPQDDLLRLVQIGLIASLVGLSINLIGAEVSVAGLLARTIAQPQRTAIYDSDQFVRVLDVLVVLTNTSLAGAHLISHISSLWSFKQFE